MSSAATIVGEEYTPPGFLGTSERQLPNGSMAVSNYSSRFYEAGRAKRAFTVVFGATGTGLAITTIGTTNACALYNPVASGYNLSILSVRLGFVSATALVLGAIMHGVNTNLNATATTGTSNTAVAVMAGSGATSVASPLYTVTLPASPTPTRVFAYKQPDIATGNSYVLEDHVDGAICLGQGATWSLYVIGSDNTSKWQISCTWAEEKP